jgi:hypothetical protein
LIELIIGFKIVSYSYITAEMEVEQVTELLKAMLAKMAAMNAKLDMRNAELDAHHERMMGCLGKTEATDLEANPELENSHVEVGSKTSTVAL